MPCGGQPLVQRGEADTGSGCRGGTVAVLEQRFDGDTLAVRSYVEVLAVLLKGLTKLGGH